MRAIVKDVMSAAPEMLSLIRHVQGAVAVRDHLPGGTRRARRSP